MTRIFPILCLLSLSILTQADSKQWNASPVPLEKLEAAPVALIPHPRYVTWNKGKFLELNSLSKFQAPPETKTAIRAIVELTIKPSNDSAHSKKENKTSSTSLTIKLDPAKVPHPEGYHLLITEKSCTITAHDPAGAFYATQTIRQLLRTENGVTTLPACEISDHPAFPVRSFMHDTGRNFQTVESLKAQLDIFAQYKINHFHWHLTDNPAWRIECKAYPQLNDPKFRRPGRNPESTYTYDQIRELIAYAKKRHITIIPELDMPGHSEYFTKTFGFKMGTPKSLPILEALIDEWCNEIPVEDCPHLHIGADEVHIKDPKGFMKRITAKVRANNRIPILWTPGLAPADKSTILQPWGDNAYKGNIEKIPNPILDSGAGYLNSGDAQWLPMKYFFWQPCGVPTGSEKHIGGELCMWPDVRVDDKSKIFSHSPVWPTLITFAESTWLGRTHADKHHMNTAPLRGTDAWKYLREFENRMADHRHRFFADKPFPWIKQTAIQWRTVGPFPHADDKNWSRPFEPEAKPHLPSYKAGDKTLKWSSIGGTTPNLPYWRTKPVSTTYLKTTFTSPVARTAHFRIGFDTPSRSHRRSSGIPQNGSWDQNGGTVFLNGKEIPGPKWNNPGTQRYTYKTWHKPPQEIPFADEEFYWTTEPVKVQLKKGENTILIRIPYTHKFQSLKATAIPVKKQGNHWVYDNTISN